MMEGCGGHAHVWISKVRGVKQGGMLRRKSLLVFGMLRAHLADGIVRDMNTDLYNIPGWPHATASTTTCLPQQAF